MYIVMWAKIRNSFPCLPLSISTAWQQSARAISISSLHVDWSNHQYHSPPGWPDKRRSRNRMHTLILSFVKAFGYFNASERRQLISLGMSGDYNRSGWSVWNYVCTGKRIPPICSRSQEEQKVSSCVDALCVDHPSSNRQTARCWFHYYVYICMWRVVEYVLFKMPKVIRIGTNIRLYSSCQFMSVHCWFIVSSLLSSLFWIIRWTSPLLVIVTLLVMIPSRLPGSA